MNDLRLKATTGRDRPGDLGRRPFWKSFEAPALLGAVAAYLLLAAGSAARKAPWSDEGFLTGIAYQLRITGTMGSPNLEPGGLGYIYLPAIEKFTYWHMPLYFLLEADWSRLFGLSPLGIRSLSVAAGLLALLSFRFTFRELLGPTKATIATFLLAVNYTLIQNASTARVDMLSAAFAALAYAAYLALRKRTLVGALLAAHALVTASGLTHPLGALIAFPSLAYLMWLRDSTRINFRHLLLSATPYLVGGVCWLLYILEAPSVFWAQFSANLRVDGRAGIFTSPWAAILGEVTQRYWTFSGFSSPHMLARMRLLILIAFLASILATLMVPTLRRAKGHHTLALLAGLQTLILALIDGRKDTLYLVHTFPVLVGLTGATAYSAWKERLLPRVVTGAAFLAFILVNVGGSLYLIYRNDYLSSYKPVAEFITQRRPGANLIFAGSEFAPPIEFAPVLRQDAFLGLDSGKVADWVVMSSFQRGLIQGLRDERPEVPRHVNRLLATRYRQVYSNSVYTVYELTGKPRR
jgi:4-amino-4-deoxy-L-arabinose transferase-like glycosyltransferase